MSAITSHFRQAKAGGTSSKSRSKQQEERPESVGVSGDAAVNDLDLSSEDRKLRSFDLCTKYGPCVGMTRLERWERANKFGLSPPQDVRDIILAAGEDSRSNKPIWDGRV